MENCRIPEGQMHRADLIFVCSAEDYIPAWFVDKALWTKVFDSLHFWTMIAIVRGTKTI
jgi:hypothetical protein